MPTKYSAGIVLFRRTTPAGVEVLLGHIGGPLWARKDAGAWSIPKGEYIPGDEEPVDAARREFGEELGLPVPDGELVDLASVRLSSGKVVTAWALEGDLDPADIVPGTFEMEWPPRSGTRALFPEIDRAEWFDLDRARVQLSAGQLPFLDRLADLLAADAPRRRHL